MHGPDGLSRRYPQPDDDPIDETDGNFDKWINNCYSFMHFLNLTHSTARRVAVFAMRTRARTTRESYPRTDKESNDGESSDNEEPAADYSPLIWPSMTSTRDPSEGFLDYSDIPRKPRAIQDNDKLEMVRKFLKDLVKPPLEEKQLG
jgi:hypothetical protein